MNAWIARDRNGELFLYGEKPFLWDDVYVDPNYSLMIRLPNEMYPEVTFGNSPYELIIND